MSQNIFLTELLTLQQDGQAAISGPINWNKSPLLEVRTGLHSDVELLANSMLDEGTKVGNWHFFVGSPGNGKSAGAGMLVRKLIKGGQIIVEAEHKLPIEELDQSRVPYCLEVRRPREKFPYLFIAQDASVLPNPFDTDADPARALLELLIDSTKRGVSLVVCTNRGVIERAYAQANGDPDSKNAVWFNALRVAVGNAPTVTVDFSKTAKKPVFASVTVTATSLDRRSLVLNSDTLDRLIDNAVAAEKWKTCEQCPAKSLCPFSSNRDWLAERPLRANVLRVIRHAELIEGQIIVLREALALISLILSGCPHDYTTASPCDWVHSKIEKGDIFSLASRRIYMLLFSAYSPMGLADDPRDLRSQNNDIGSICKYGAGTSDKTRSAVGGVIDKKNWPSTDVGAPRLLGQAGIFSELDVLAGVPNAGFSDRWSESWKALEQDAVWASGIERALVVCWRDLQRAAAGSNQQSPSIYRWLSRWITSYSLRIGSLVEGVTTFCEDLDALVEILQIKGQPSEAQEALLTGIEATLESSLTEGNKGLMLTPTTTLHGRWASQALKPRFATAEAGTLTATLQFGSASKSAMPLNTRAFIWLKRRAERNMDSATFPKEYLETARDAMLRVATSTSYDTKDEVILRIDVGQNRTVEIRRSHRGVYIEYV
jgi:hypothetical protein